MAIATLDKVFNNRDVFTGVCKIRKGMSCKLLLNTNSKSEVHRTFARFARSIMSQAPVGDPSHGRTIKACRKILEICEESYVGEAMVESRLMTFVKIGNFVAPVVVAVCAYLLNVGRVESKWGEGVMLPRLVHTEDVMLLALAVFAIVYLLCFSAIGLMSGGGGGGKEEGVKSKGGMRRSTSEGKLLVPAEEILSSKK